MHALAGAVQIRLGPGVAAALLDFCWSAAQPASRSEMAGNCCPADMNRTGFLWSTAKAIERPTVRRRLWIRRSRRDVI